MPVVKCRNCGYDTNTALSKINFRTRPYIIADGCYARFINGKWERGCCYETALEYKKKFIDELVEGEKK